MDGVGFFERQTMIFEASLKPADKMILTVLNSHLGDNGRCWPRLETIAYEASMSRTTVLRRIESLKEIGVVATRPMRRADGGNSSLAYVLLWERLREIKRPKPKATTRIQNETGDPFQNEDGPALTTERAELLSREQIRLKDFALSGEPLSSRPAKQQTTTNGKTDRKTWLTPYMDAWLATYGSKMTMTGVAARVLRPLEKEHGPTKTLTHFVKYVKETPAKFVSLYKFADTFAQWGDGASSAKNWETMPADEWLEGGK